MKPSIICTIGLFVLVSFVCSGLPQTPPPNPVLTGSDPHVLQVGNQVWVYPAPYANDNTLLYAYSSTNLTAWEQHGPIITLDDISWVKEDGAALHALRGPSVIESEGIFYLYFTVDSQDVTPSRIGVGIADKPAGPFVDSGQPLLSDSDGFGATDPMVFMDPKSGDTYFYAGGSAGATLRVFEMERDLVSFAREIAVDTPPHFTGAPFMHEYKGLYYLSYSGGAWNNATGSAHYAKAATPVGPWQYEARFLASDGNHKGPGHPALFCQADDNQWFVAYHRWNYQRGPGPYNATRQIAIDVVSYDDEGRIEPVAMTGGNADFSMAPTVLPPGVVITHSPQASGLYIGSPSITVLSDGAYLAAHDYFGPESDEHECAMAQVFRSKDRGATWQKLVRLKCLFWPKLFMHQDAVYLLGVEKHHGRIVIRRSTDGGENWTEPRDTASGLLTPTGEYHTAPMPVLVHDGRLWRAFEDAMGGERWGERYRAFMMSIAMDADLLHADNWTFSNAVARDPEWLGGDFAGWLEGNAVLTPEGNLVNILRVAAAECPEQAAIITVSHDGKTAAFDPTSGFIEFPGGAKKFTIRYDESTEVYWSIASIVLDRHKEAAHPSRIRNTLALIRSADLYQWEVRSIVLYHPDVASHGFQYVDWCFDGDDLIAVCRTAHEDGIGGARNNHDANFLTFHRFEDFRNLGVVGDDVLPDGTRPIVAR